MELPEDVVESFASLDRARLSRMSDDARAKQLEARQALLEYAEALWQDVRRAGEQPDVGEKYEALAIVREVARSLTAVAFDTVYNRQAP
ncbi:hypothetical protein [Pseudonocardia adelaidensis]|uniref:Uncharacterized protein n=1 Tax=Pseudonocardia adelaidensis TaxID=648754 RepID=A0ABP9NHL2_9PSEU